MSTAAERAAEVIRRRFQVRAATAEYAIDALMADPDLLRELADEAARLEEDR